MLKTKPPLRLSFDLYTSRFLKRLFFLLRSTYSSSRSVVLWIWWMPTLMFQHNDVDENMRKSQSNQSSHPFCLFPPALYASSPFHWLNRSLRYS